MESALLLACALGISEIIAVIGGFVVSGPCFVEEGKTGLLSNGKRVLQFTWGHITVKHVKKPRLHHKVNECFVSR